MTSVAAAVNLFPALDAAGARYVHWKSNEHLAAALAGETDLDILFDRSQYRLVLRVLDECGYKPFRTTDQTGYPGIEDHFAIDPQADKSLALGVVDYVFMLALFAANQWC